MLAAGCRVFADTSREGTPSSTSTTVAVTAPGPDAAPEPHAVAQVVTGILGYARWPRAQQQQPPQLCVTGATRVADALLAGDGAPPGARARQVTPAETNLSQTCEALYVGELPPVAMTRLLQTLIGQPVVTIVENDPDCSAGGMFCLRGQGTQVGFLINLDIIARSGVRIHPSVLQLARRQAQP